MIYFFCIIYFWVSILNFNYTLKINLYSIIVFWNLIIINFI